jgi:coenzyme F420-0:L-glutamate ligase/coenzyme F420-1:gamma-L-glutamate ligase
MLSHELRIRGLTGMPEIGPGADVAAEILAALARLGIPIRGEPAAAAAIEPWVIVVAQKVVSKAEGRLVRLEETVPSPEARDWAAKHQRDPRLVEVVLQQSRRAVKMEKGLMIMETGHGFVCANAGVDVSNAPPGMAVLLPEDPDRSADRLRRSLETALGRPVAVIISDTFGRPWRVGLTNVAIGIAGMPAVLDYRGQCDSRGRVLQATVLAIADELAAAAELVMGKTDGIPAVLIEGFRFAPAEGSARDLIRGAESDLFR